MNNAKPLHKTLEYIDKYWSKIIHDPSESAGDPHVIPLPNTFITTNATSHWKNAMFYWDSFFMFRGLIDTNRDWVIPEVVDNFVYLFNNFGIIPNASVWSFLGHSQPPFFSSMIIDAYYAIRRSSGNIDGAKNSYSEHWLRHRIEIAKKEYWQVWEDENTYHHKISGYELSRYGDRDVGYPLTSERESGWDFTMRFYNRCHEFLAVDLNSLLHKYETDFAKTAHILGEKDEKYWDDRAKKRRENVKKYMWNKEKGFFFDYDYAHKQQSEFYSLAGFTPLWAKIATYEEAKQAVKNLALFETEYGLTATAQISMPKPYDLDDIPDAFKYSIEDLFKPKQWDFPHIWAPAEYLTVIGLLRYGFVEDAVRIMNKSIKANILIYEKFGTLLEKIDATTIQKPKTFWYPTEEGFGWTNAIFYRYVQILEYIEKMDGNIYGDQPKLHEPPYSLTNILH